MWDYVNRFARFMPFQNRVKTTAQGQSLLRALNLLTINQFFGTTLRQGALSNPKADDHHGRQSARGRPAQF